MDGWGEGVDAFGLVHPLPEEQLAHLDLFMAARHVPEMLWAIDLAQANPDFREQVDEWLTYAARHVNRYLDGE
jgi:hypothetical protein